MRKVLALACAASAFALISNANAADQSSATISFTGKVDPFCYITSGNASVDFASPFAVDGMVASGQTAQSNVTFRTNAKCSTKVVATKAKLDAGGAEYVPYTVDFITQTGKTPTIAAAGFITDAAWSGAASDLKITTGTQSTGANPLPAGNYTDTLTVSVSGAM
jgi:hypothetical protein